MYIECTNINDLLIINVLIHYDARGYFFENWSKKEFEQLNLNYSFVQDNESYNKNKNTLRGLHFQNGEYSQAKLVRCIKGSVFDVAVDLRKNSQTYKKWFGIELSEDNKKMLMIPRGFAHGYLTLTDNTVFQYKVDNIYNKDSERSIIWNDETFKINWNISSPLLSEKDNKAPMFKDIENIIKF